MENQEQSVRHILQLDNGKYANIEYEGGTHVRVQGVTDIAYATMYEDKEELEEFKKDATLYNEKGFGFEEDTSDYQYHGECTLPKEICTMELAVKQTSTQTLETEEIIRLMKKWMGDLKTGIQEDNVLVAALDTKNEIKEALQLMEKGKSLAYFPFEIGDDWKIVE